MTRRLMFLLLLATAPLAHGTSERVPLLRVGNEHFVALEDMAVFYGLTYLPPSGRMLRLRSPRSALEFEAGYRQAWVNGIQVWLHAPVQKVDNRWAITQTDMSTFIDPVLRTHAHLPHQRGEVVVLDPGHGGRDPGALSHRGLNEKTLALDIARRVRVELADQGLRVLMTREDDRYIPLEKRCAFAADHGADLFVSIHLNAAGNRYAQGLETYVMTAPGYPSSQASGEATASSTSYRGNGFGGPNTCLAYAIQKSLVRETGGHDRGLRHARFMVLKHAPCPAALVECGFLTNVRDESMLRSPSHLNNVAQGVARGVLEYLDAVKRARVVAAQVEPPFGLAQLLSGRTEGGRAR